MAEKVTPRVFIVRHGETEWSLNGRYFITDVNMQNH
jgi:broad specificity phosphatase PhoE